MTPMLWATLIGCPNLQRSKTPVNEEAVEAEAESAPRTEEKKPLVDTGKAPGAVPEAPEPTEPDGIEEGEEEIEGNEEELE